MPRPRGPISTRFAENVIKFLESPPESKKAADVLEYRNRLAALEMYREKYKTANRNGNSLRELTYSTLPELLRTGGMTLRDAYNCSGLSISWPSEKFKEFAYMLDEVPESALSRIEKTISAMAPRVWEDERLLDERPTLRACHLIHNHIARMDRLKTMPESLAAAWNDKKRFTMVPIEKLPEASEYLGMSLHWLVCPRDYDLRCYSSTETGERILDAFCFLSEQDQDNIMVAIKPLMTQPKRKRGGRR